MLINTAWTSRARRTARAGCRSARAGRPRPVGVQLVISDAHPGLVAAIGSALPGAAWQRCRTHYLRNLLSRVPKSAQPHVATQVRAIFGPSRRRCRGSPVRPRHRRPRAPLPRRGRAPRHRPRGTARLHRLPARDLAADLVEQPARAAEQTRSAAAPTWSGSSLAATP
jgi:hypothetical protein